jgi:spore maturation protein CgeB
MAGFDLSAYDGVLAFGDIIRQWHADHHDRPALTWHEAADAEVFRPFPDVAPVRDVVWIGNWGDDERTAELHEFLIEPIRDLGLTATVHGVRYPDAARQALEQAGIAYGGYLPNHRVPEVFAQHRLTVHVPRGFYTRHLPGIPTIRPFEALACGMPLLSAPWTDAEDLFRVGTDFRMVQSGAEMRDALRDLLRDDGAAERRRALGIAGRERVLDRHTCAHRVDELLGHLDRLDQPDVPVTTGPADGWS